MKKIRILIYIHIFFWVSLVILGAFKFSILIFGIPIPVALLFWTFSLPILLKITHNVHVESQSKLIKNYFFTFSWVAYSMLLFSILVIFLVFFVNFNSPRRP